MLFTNHKANHFSPLRIFALLALMIIVLCGAAANKTTAQTSRSTYLDFTGDGKTDWATIKVQQNEPGNPYTWRILGNQTDSVSSTPFIRVFNYGLLGDALHPGDYIGDRKTEMAVYRSGQPGIFYVAQFPIGADPFKLEPAVRWGAESDSSYAPGDYDGDGKMDYTVVRYNAPGGKLTWFILQSSTNTMRAVPFAFLGGETSHGADFTGDGRDELVYITYGANGNVTYYIGDAVTGAWLSTHFWGNGNLDFIYPRADYTGDGKADLVAVRRRGVNPMVWFILDPATNTSKVFWWGKGSVNAGEAFDFPVQGDYDGDGIYDIAVYRSSTRTFYVLRSSDNGLIVQPWGEDGDLPIVPGLVYLRTT